MRYYEKGILDTASDPSVSGAEIRVALQTGAARVRSDHTPDGGARIPSLPSDRGSGLRSTVDSTTAAGDSTAAATATTATTTTTADTADIVDTVATASTTATADTASHRTAGSAETRF